MEPTRNLITAPTPIEVPPPKPVYRRKHWPVRVAWLVTLCVAAGAALYGKQFLSQQGPLVTIRVDTAEGIKVNDTPVVYRGVQVGRVTGIDLSKDHRKALIEVRLQSQQQAFTKEGAAFWIVRPEVSGIDFHGLGTIFSGPYIDSTPGSGRARKSFTALARPPSVFEDGLNLIVHASRMDHLEEHSPVYYRGVQVGAVRSVALGREADRVEARLVIWRRYDSLVRAGSKFWTVSGFEVKGGILSGVELKLNSLKSFVSGGIAFATPDKDMGPPAAEGADFVLEPEAKDEWKNWAPRIAIRPGAAVPVDQEQSRGGLRSMAGRAGGSLQ